MYTCVCFCMNKCVPVACVLAVTGGVVLCAHGVQV